MSGIMGSKSCFNKTCNLLSQYLKEKRLSGDFILTNNPVANAEPKGALDSDSMTATMATMNLFPLSSGVGFYDETAPKSAATSAQVSPQLTIFYGGQVIVYNDVPAEKVKEILELANRMSALTMNGVDVTGRSMGLDSPAVGGNGSASVLPNRMKVSDLPIARKASLHRFFEKRKDRLNARAPYTLNNPAANKSKPNDQQSKSAASPWLGLAAAQPELRS